MVILMGVRLDRYKEKEKKKHKKIYGFLKTTIIILMFVGFSIGIIYVNKTIEDLNYIDNTVLFGIDFQEKIFTFLGKSYTIEFDKILDIFKPD